MNYIRDTCTSSLVFRPEWNGVSGYQGNIHGYYHAFFHLKQNILIAAHAATTAISLSKVRKPL
jgi:hypothetical protein